MFTVWMQYTVQIVFVFNQWAVLSTANFSFVALDFQKKLSFQEPWLRNYLDIDC